MSIMSRITRSKTNVKEKNNKDPNFGIFLDSNGCVSETYHLDWSRIYSIFNNDDFSGIQPDHSTFMNIRKSQLHAIETRPSLMSYIDTEKWIVYHANPLDYSFTDHGYTQLASFCPEVFARAYTLNLPQQFVNK